MVWGGIPYDYRTNIVTFERMVNDVRYKDEVLLPIELPFRPRMGANSEFQHDNARPTRLTSPGIF
jgi:hypothetical protein